MKLIAKDYNGDGTVNIDFKEEVYIPEMMNSKPNELSSSDKFNLELALGDCVIYIMDESFYRGNKQYMCDLEDVLGYLPDAAYDDRAIRCRHFRRIKPFRDYVISIRIPIFACVKNASA